MADEEVTPSLAEVLEQHQLTDTPTWACERVCSCGENVHTLIHHRGHAAHVATALQASFVVVPKPGPLTRQQARELYDSKLREMYPDDAVLMARLDELQREEKADG